MKCSALGAVLVMSGVLGGLLLAFPPGMRELSQSEMASVKGAGIGDFCTEVGHNHTPGKCGAFASFACMNLCNPCSRQRQATCGAFSCWRCSIAASIKECLTNTGEGCTEFGGGVACGDKESAQCLWDPVEGTCYCPTLGPTSVACPRKHCI